MEMDKSLTHINERGEMNIVDISDKVETKREALAEGYINLNKEILEKIKNEKIKKGDIFAAARFSAKGDIFAAARFSAINGAKKTSELIPLCHNLSLNKITIDFEICESMKAIKIIAFCKSHSKTGVEMEALTSVSIGLLTLYDMLKALDPFMTIDNIRLLEKKGGKNGILKRS